MTTADLLLYDNKNGD